MCHEHLYHKSYTKTFVPVTEPCAHSDINSKPVSIENLWYTKYHPYTHESNLDFTSLEIQHAISNEMCFFKQNGGQTVVEVTTFGKNLKVLAEMSKKSGVNIIGNTGFYIAPAFSDDITTRSMESLYSTMKDEFTNGLDGYKPGVIGEIASNWPIHQFEKNVLVASAHIQSELSVPVIIHPGRNAEAPFEVMRIFAEAGGNCQKTVMSHLDRTLNASETVEFAEKTKTICEFDLFGNEVSYYQCADYAMPNDAARIEQIKALIENGYADQITVSHDIHTKHRLMKFGGHGFSHILLNTVPKMKQRGISQHDIDKILVETPRRWLTL